MTKITLDNPWDSMQWKQTQDGEWNSDDYYICAGPSGLYYPFYGHEILRPCGSLDEAKRECWVHAQGIEE